MKIYVKLFLAIILVLCFGYCFTFQLPKTHITVKSGEDTGGLWKSRFQWKAHWVKHWDVKKVWVPVWKKVWSPVEIREWIPFPKLPVQPH